MIQKTEQEKSAIKAAKKAYKNAQNNNNTFNELISHPKEKLNKKEKIFNGIMEGENPLPDDYPIIGGYTYVVDDNEGKVIISHINGSVKGLRQALKASGYKADIIRNCEVKKRNLF